MSNRQHIKNGQGNEHLGFWNKQGIEESSEHHQTIEPTMVKTQISLWKTGALRGIGGQNPGWTWYSPKSWQVGWTLSQHIISTWRKVTGSVQDYRNECSTHKGYWMQEQLHLRSGCDSDNPALYPPKLSQGRCRDPCLTVYCLTQYQPRVIFLILVA